MRLRLRLRPRLRLHLVHVHAGWDGCVGRWPRLSSGSCPNVVCATCLQSVRNAIEPLAHRLAPLHHSPPIACCPLGMRA